MTTASHYVSEVGALDRWQELDPENPAGVPDEMIAISGSPAWHALGERERMTLRHYLQAWQLSQFLHGEQGALVWAGNASSSTRSTRT
jgi:hypothetical protein